MFMVFLMNIEMAKAKDTFVSKRPFEKPRTRFVVIFLVVVELLFLGTGYAIAALVPSAPGYVVTLGSEVAILILAFGVLLKLGWVSKVGFNRRKKWRDMRVLILPAVVVIFIFLIGLGSPFSLQSLGIAVLAAIIVGMSEESVMRGVTLQALLPKGAKTAVVLTAVAFALLHLNNLIQAGSKANLEGVLANALYAFLFGIAVGAFRIRTNTIWPSVTFHALTDFPGLLAIVWGTTSISSTSPSIAGLVLETGLGALLAGYGLFLLRKKKNQYPFPQS
jgi:membrane protease YdiL (CAAX protease family)